MALFPSASTPTFGLGLGPAATRGDAVSIRAGGVSGPARVGDGWTLQIEGLEELLSELGEVDRELPRVVKRTGRKFSRRIAATARKIAPDSSNRPASALPKNLAGGRRQGESPGALRRSIKDRTVGGLPGVKVGGDAAPYAPVVHFGHTDRPPMPLRRGQSRGGPIRPNRFLDYAAGQEIPQIVAGFEREVDQALRKIGG